MSAQTRNLGRKRRDTGHCYEALAIGVAFLILTGCQGLSSGGSNTQQQQPQNGVLGLSGSGLHFGTVIDGNTKTLTITAKNSGSASLTIASAQSSAPQFALTKPSLPLVIDAGATATLSVTFSPKAPGTTSGTISITSDASNGPVGLQVNGDGSAPGVLSASPANFVFGSVLVGNSQTLPGTLTNVGSSNLTVSQANVSGAGFSLSGLTLPVTLAPNQSTNFNAIFDPQSAGAANGSVSFVSDASNSPLNAAMSGTGLAPGSLSATPPSVAFGNVTVGNNQSLPETLTNTSGASVTITQAAATGPGFSITGLNLPITLQANQSTGFSVTFDPLSSGPIAGSVTITSNASNPSLVIPLSGVGIAPGTLSPNPATLTFGSVQVGHNKTLPETITNTGGSNATITQDTISGSGMSVSGLNLPITLTPGGSTSFNVIFAPQSTGGVNGNLTITSDASNPTLIIALSGTGTPAGQLAVNPTTLNFGNVVVGNNSGLPASLKATGAAVTVTSGVSSSSEFVLSGINFPVTIQAGGSQGFTVTFTPQSTGQANATLTFNSDASNSPTVQTLTGDGINATHHSVLLNWNASSSSGVVGYNVFRGTSHGGPYSQINSSLDGNTSYTDNNVSNNTTYYYVTTAVDSNNQQSGYSNEAQANIPNN